MKTSITLMLIFLHAACSTQGQEPKKILKDGMTVSWYFDDTNIHFKMSAPTTGWVTVGFNETTEIKNAYLLMGHVTDGKANVVEHFTQSPGNYTPIENLGSPLQVRNVSGQENKGNTTINFTLPIDRPTAYQKELVQGKQYQMILAYSLEDDFQHHSIMRTSVDIQL